MMREMIRGFVLFPARLALAFVLIAGPGFAAEEKQTAREAVGKPVQAAEQFLKQKKYKEALAKLAEADAVANKTPYETYVIEGTRAAILLNDSDYTAAVKALEAVLATRILPPAEALTRVKALVQLDYQIKNYPGVVTYAERYYRDGGTDEEPRTLEAQAYYLQNDFANASKTIRAVLQNNEKTGKPASEETLLMLLSSDYKQGDKAAYLDTLKKLAAHYPKKAYWVDILGAVQKQPGFSRRLALDVDRLKVATGAMTAPGDYMEAAQLALQEGLPGDAKSLLDKGYAAGVLGKGAEAERQQRLAVLAARQSGDDMKNLPQLARDADAANSGLAWVKLGEAYASYGQYENAIAAFDKGLGKGGLKYPEDAKLHLGLAYLGAGQKAKARDVLKSVTGKDGAQDLADLWFIQSGAAN